MEWDAAVKVEDRPLSVQELLTKLQYIERTQALLEKEFENTNAALLAHVQHEIPQDATTGFVRVDGCTLKFKRTKSLVWNTETLMRLGGMDAKIGAVVSTSAKIDSKDFKNLPAAQIDLLKDEGAYATRLTKIKLSALISEETTDGL